MRASTTTHEIICDFDDEAHLNHAISELEEHNFPSDTMGIEKTVDEYVEISDHNAPILRSWLIRHC